jgi:hypothetical protein
MLGHKPTETDEKESKTNTQASWLEKPEERQLHHNHEQLRYLNVLLLFAQCKRISGK